MLSKISSQFCRFLKYQIKNKESKNNAMRSCTSENSVMIWKNEIFCAQSKLSSLLRNITNFQLQQQIWISVQQFKATTGTPVLFVTAEISVRSKELVQDCVKSLPSVDFANSTKEPIFHFCGFIIQSNQFNALSSTSNYVIGETIIKLKLLRLGSTIFWEKIEPLVTNTFQELTQP